jgi:DNA-binding XRE family transcriptional regulator
VKISYKAARINAELSVSDVAKTLNVTEQTIRNYEQHRTAPKPAILKNLADLYGCKVDDFKEVSGE